MDSPDTSINAPARDAARRDLACPRCAGPVVNAAGGITCRACATTYPVRDGIADFRCDRQNYYFNPVPRPEMEELTRQAHSQPWERTIRRFLASVGHKPEWFDDLVVDGRYAWKLLLRLPGSGRLLDVGCGLGNLVKNLAPQVGRVDALDLTMERLKFARVRFQHFNAADQITLLAGGDGTHLPFPEHSFDCVTLSGVLEWVAVDDRFCGSGKTRLQTATGAFSSFFGASNPRKMQVRFLREIRRILKPDGQLFVAIGNRRSYCYFGKQPDQYSSLWFASLLPRFLANIYSILVSRRPYRTYTYSVKGFRRLLGEAGFANLEFYGLTPGYRQLAELIPLQPPQTLWRPRTPRGLERVKRNWRFVPAYGIVASQELSHGPSLAKQLAASLASQLGAEVGDVQFSRYEVTSKSKGIISAEVKGQPFIVKVPFNEPARVRAARNYQFLVSAYRWERLRAYVPRAVGEGEIQGIHFYAEGRVAGWPVRCRLHAVERATWFAAASEFLTVLNADFAEREASPLAGEALYRLVLEPLQCVARAVSRSLVDDMRGFIDKRLEGLSSRFGMVQGDFSTDNVFVHGTSVVGVIDWDDSESLGIPALDALDFVNSAYRGLNPRVATADVISRLSQWRKLADDERLFLETNYRACGMDVGQHFPLVFLYWLRHVADQLDGGLIYNQPAIDERITTVFERLLHAHHRG